MTNRKPLITQKGFKYFILCIIKISLQKWIIYSTYADKRIVQFILFSLLKMEYLCQQIYVKLINKRINNYLNIILNIHVTYFNTSFNFKLLNYYNSYQIA